MPIPLLPLIGSALGTGANIGGSFLQNHWNKREAEKQRQWSAQQQGAQNIYNKQQTQAQNAFNLSMWNKTNKYNEGQIQSARDYNKQMWELQNQYNSPAEQMARMKEAGLNPHLMYGKGTVGQAGQLNAPSPNKAAAPTMSPMQGATGQGYTRPQMNNVLQGFDAMGKYAHLKQLQAQTNNVEAQTNVAQQNARLLGQKSLMEALNIKGKSLSNQVARGMAKYTLEGAEQNMRMLEQQIREQTAKANVALGTQSSAIQRAKAELTGIMRTNTGKSLDNRLKSFESTLNKHGLTKSDDLMLRILIMSANEDESNLAKYIPFINKFMPRSALKYFK